MKKLTMRAIAALLVSAAVAFSSCSKEGPAGATGPAGPAGPTGATGAQGATGTANVIYSQWTNVTFTNGVGRLTATDLSKEILNSGSIKVYMNMGNVDTPFVVQIPCVIPYAIATGDTTGTNPDIYMDPYFKEGEIILSSNYNLTSSGGFFQYRYILIPGGTPAGRKSSNNSVDWSNYAAVKKYLNLKD